MVWVLVRMNHLYSREHAELDDGLEAFQRGMKGRPTSLLIVENLDRKTMHALQYAKTIRSSITYAVARGGGATGRPAPPRGPG